MLDGVELVKSAAGVRPISHVFSHYAQRTSTRELAQTSTGCPIGLRRLFMLKKKVKH